MRGGFVDLLPHFLTRKELDDILSSKHTLDSKFANHLGNKEFWEAHWKGFEDSLKRNVYMKSMPHLFPPKALALAGEVLAFGETKHPDMKWKQMTSDEHMGAVFRHVLEHLAGNTKDSESGKLHLAHALVRLGMALERYVDNDPSNG